MIHKFFHMAGQVGLKNTIVGAVKLHIYSRLQLQYGFYHWNRMPFELRKYIQEAADIINKDAPDIVVDIGCGLGELLRHINAECKLGVDLDEKSIMAAKFLDKTGQIDFLRGSFDEIHGMTGDYVVTLNFMGGQNAEHWMPYYRRLLKENSFQKVLVDVLPEKNGNHYLDFAKILPEEYQLIVDKGPFMAGRHIQVYEKIK